MSNKQKKFTILIAEDAHINYFYLHELINNILIPVQNLKLNILHAEDGQEAIEICKNNSEIDIIFMDLIMPIVNGFEASKRIKEFQLNLPIIAQSASVTEEDTENAKRAGCDDFISKPINRETIIKIIEKYSSILQ